MKFIKIFYILMIFIIIDKISAKSRFLKIEECSATNISTKVYICEIVNGKLNLQYEIIRPLDHAQVKFLIII